MQHNWTDIVYDIYTYLYREPQTIDCVRKQDKKKYDSENNFVLWLQKREVVLNHIFNIFFQCLNTKQIVDFFEEVTHTEDKNDDYKIFVRDMSEVIEMNNIFNPTQPDILFVWDHNTISLEMKIWSKSDYDQILKYAFLHHQEYIKSWRNKNHHLILLWKWNFNNFRSKKYNSVEDLKKDCLANIYNIKNKYRPYIEGIEKMISKLHIHHISYWDLYNYLSLYSKTITDKKVQRTYTDFMNELSKRNLINL